MPLDFKVGVKGGNLENPNQVPERRLSEFNGVPAQQLHRFEKDHDVAMMGLKNEQPWHRLAAYMLVAGRTNSEVAMAAGVTPQHVCILKSQKWFQELLVTIANETGEEVVGVIQGEALASIERIRALRDGSESDRVALAAAIFLVEQANGRATQKTVSLVSHSKLPPEQEYAELQLQLAALRETS